MKIRFGIILVGLCFVASAQASWFYCQSQGSEKSFIDRKEDKETISSFIGACQSTYSVPSVDAYCEIWGRKLGLPKSSTDAYVFISDESHSAEENCLTDHQKSFNEQMVLGGVTESRLENFYPATTRFKENIYGFSDE